MASKTDPDYLKDLPAGVFDLHPGDKILNVGIIGAGIAGMSAAAGLLRSGHNVEIFERSSFGNEVGAAIHVCPNASRVLRYWGFDFKAAGAVTYGYGHVLTGDNLKTIYRGTYEHWPEKYGAEAYFLHRVDLHNGLKYLALDGGQNNPAAKLHTASEVVDLDCKTGLMALADGRTFQKDLVIVADGVHSRFVKQVTGHDTLALSTDHSAFRFTIPTQTLLDASETKSLFDRPGSGITIYSLDERRLVWYPCQVLYTILSGYTLRLKESTMKKVYHHRTRDFDAVRSEGLISPLDWNVSAPLTRLLQTYEGFNPSLIEVCKKAEDLKLWKLLFRKPIPSWTKDKAILIGDAAHPMLPHQGQGGGQAIEDGGALGALFSHITSLDEIPVRMRIFEKVRKNRASAMQMLSNAGQDEAEKIEKDAQPYIVGPVPKIPEQFHEYNFGSNVFKDCAEALGNVVSKSYLEALKMSSR